MPGLPDNLAELLRARGATVIEIDGYKTRGRPGHYNPVGVNNHHTGAYDGVGDPAQDLEYAKWMFLVGREPKLPAPLVQATVSAEGVIYLGALGKSNHAGPARSSGSVAAGEGNSLYVGLEWMLSGTQTISKEMYHAAAIFNGVVLDHFGNSVQALSCHFQTSTTGKWDIGDPNGVPYRDKKVLNVPKFREYVADLRETWHAPPTPSGDKYIKVLHASLDFTDNDKQHRQDTRDLLRYMKQENIAWGTFTETGDNAGNTQSELLKWGEKFGFHMHVPGAAKSGHGSLANVSVATRKSFFVPGTMKTGYERVIPSSGELNVKGAGWNARGIAWSSFENKQIGRCTPGVGHYLPGRFPGADEWNRTYAEAIGDWAREKGKGWDLVFYHGDQNMNDRFHDTFFGSPLTSVQDELRRWEPTRQGGSAIDVISTYNRDNRVKAHRVEVLDDKEFFQHSDHYPVVATLRVRKL